MGLKALYDEQVLPRFTDLALGRPMEDVRARVTQGLAGDVLEVGFGSGRNVPHLPSPVTRLLAVEPSGVGRRLARKRVAASPVPVEFIGLDGQDLPLPDESVDHVLITFTMCTIPDVDRALREIRRVLKPGGTLHFAEHGRSPKPAVAHRQDQLTPLWRKVFGGCHLNRKIDDLVEGAGLRLDHLEAGRMGGPEFVAYGYGGVAVKPV